MNVRYRRLAVVIAALVAMSMLLVACGDDDKSDTTSSTPAADTTASTTAASTISVPDAFKGKTLVVAADASYAPNEYVDKDGKTVVGMDVDLIKAIAAKLGLQVKVQNAPFDGIIPGIKADKYQVGISSFTDTKEREGTVDFATYFTAGSSFYVPTDGGADVKTVADLCDKKVAVQKGTVQADDAAAQAKKCKVTVEVFPDQNQVNLALKSGRADVAMADSPVAAYAVKQSNGAFKLSGESYDNAPYGIAVPKGSGLAESFVAALKELMADGQYEEILKKWGVESGAITDPVVNGATS
jgi:polar amino acid transport system substrate-binding protein